MEELIETRLCIRIPKHMIEQWRRHFSGKVFDFHNWSWQAQTMTIPDGPHQTLKVMGEPSVNLEMTPSPQSVQESYHPELELVRAIESIGSYEAKGVGNEKY